MGTLCGTVATCPDARSDANGRLSEPLITVTAHKAVRGETKCPWPEVCDQDVSVSKLVHVCVAG